MVCIEYIAMLWLIYPNDDTLYPYAVQINEYTFLDADNLVKHSVARYANDCRTISKQSKCKGNFCCIWNNCLLEYKLKKQKKMYKNK